MSSIYHYCDLNAFLNIINNKKIWLSSASNLNDYNEISYFRDIFFSELNSARTESNSHVIDDFLDVFYNVFPQPYICSFSKKKDLLSQWRAYADDGCGVAIGFSSDSFGFLEEAPFLGMCEMHSTGISDVIYDGVDNIIEFIKERINLIISSLHLHEERYFLYNNIANEIRRRCIFTKNKFFEEEEEVRIVHLPFVTGNEKGEFRYVHSLSPVKQRVSGNRITSYFEYDFSKKQNIITEVVVGPKCDITTYELELLLATNNYLNIPLFKSGASYR